MLSSYCDIAYLVSNHIGLDIFLNQLTQFRLNNTTPTNLRRLTLHAVRHVAPPKQIIEIVSRSQNTVTVLRYVTSPYVYRYVYPFQHTQSAGRGGFNA